ADAEHHRVGYATDSLVCEGCIISGGHVDHSVLSPRVRVNSYSQVSESVLLENVEIGRHAVVKRAIIDKNVVIPPRYEDWRRPRGRQEALSRHRERGRGDSQGSAGGVITSRAKRAARLQR